MARDDWAVPRPAPLKIAQRGFARLVRLTLPWHARLSLATNGIVPPSVAWRPGIILETTGRRTGRPRRAVITYLPDAERIVLVASNYGRANHPSWYENLVADPNVRVIRRGRALPFTARETSGDERADYLRRLDGATFGVYSSYARATDREIPVVVLTPAG